jgi:hypothetical protein
LCCPGALGGVQAYDEFVELGLASIRRNFRAVFPDVSDEQFLMVREYMAHWDVLRQCCGGQAARSVVAQLHAGPKSNLQPSICVRFDASFLALLREIDQSNRFVQKSAESTSI